MLFHHELSHFPIAFLLAAFVADVVVWRSASDTARIVGRVLLGAGAVCAVPSVVTGMILSIRAVTGAYPENTINLHMILGITTMVVGFTALLYQRNEGRKPGAASRRRVCLWIVALSVAATGYLGGTLGHPM